MGTTGGLGSASRYDTLVHGLGAFPESMVPPAELRRRRGPYDENRLLTRSGGAYAPRPRLGRTAPFLLAAAFVVIGGVGGGLAAWFFAPAPMSPNAVEWFLLDLDPTLAQTTTEIPIGINFWPTQPVESWLAKPKIIYTPSAVIITMQTVEGYRPGCCFYLTNWSGKVQLSEPLAGRVLMDGAFSPPAPRPLRSAIANLQILAISDWQGQLDPLSGVGGAATLSSYFDQERASRPADTGILTLTTGSDVGASTPLSTFFQDTPAILAERKMGVMVGTLGSHDFDLGIGRLQSHIDLAGANGWDSRFYYVASNLSDRGSNLEGVEDYKIFMFGDAKFAVIGVLDEKAPTPDPPGGLGTMTRTDSVAAAMAAKAGAKAAGADVFIAITDMGITGFTGADPTGDLIDFANAVSGFDVVFGRATDIQYSGTINGQLVVANRPKGMTYSKTLVTYDRLAAQRIGTSNTFVTPTAASIAPDPEIVAMLEAYRGQMALLEGTVGNTAPPTPALSNTSEDRSPACTEALSNVPAFGRRLAADIASLRPLVVAQRFDPARAANASSRIAETIAAFPGIDPPYHGCDLGSPLSTRVGDIVGRASRTVEMSQAPGITDANLQQRVVFDLYGYLPEVVPFLDATP